MDALEPFLDQYGLAAIFVLLLVKALGVPVPVPADLIMLVAAADAAHGKLPLALAFAVILLALVVGGIIQFALVRRLGRRSLSRFGPYLRLAAARLDAARAETITQALEA